jgi:thioredoxin reductase (NADPH)
MGTLIAVIFGVAITLAFTSRHVKQLKKREARARAAIEKGKLRSEGPRAQHPHIDANHCIGCATCTSVCPEGEVLGIVGGKAAIANGHKCVGHGLCAEACPVGAITMVLATPSMGVDMPRLTPEYETNVPNLFIAGELGGLALIKNAIHQGRACIDVIARRRGATSQPAASVIYDVLIVGAGPAGISASLRAIELKLNYVTIEQDQVGGTVAKFPRQKLVLTSPVEFPMYGKFKETELSKEKLLAFWNKVLQRVDFKVRGGEKVEDIRKGSDGIFTVTTNKGQYRSHGVVLCLGRSGTPRKLGVEGENLPKVMYRLIEADHYVNKQILIVGGGDSAVEAAMGLSEQKGNRVTLTYRQQAFGRIKERNAQRMQEYMRSGKVQVVFNSVPVEFRQDSVILEVSGRRQDLPNDFVWIFAGGEAPSAFLKKIGVMFGMRDMTREGSEEAKQAIPVIA